MAITTKLQTKYSLQKMLVVVICLGMGLWGVYDYLYKIPLRQRVYERGQVCFKVKQGIEKALAAENTPAGRAERTAAIDEGAAAVAEERERLVALGAKPPAGRIDARQAVLAIDQRDESMWCGLVPLFEAVMRDIGKLPINPEAQPPAAVAATFDVAKIGVDKTADVSPPGKFDRATQWMFILCLPFVPYFAWSLWSSSRKIYRLDDDGTLHAPEGSWAPSDIADIDMSRWMSKSIAHVVNSDGDRIKLDDYVYKNVHLIVGKLASERYPTEWDADAKPVKAEPEGDGGESTPDAGDDDARADETSPEPKTPAEV